MNPELKPMHSNLMQEYILLYNALKYTTDKNVYKAIQDRLGFIAIEVCYFDKNESHLEVYKFCKQVLTRFNIKIEL